MSDGEAAGEAKPKPAAPKVPNFSEKKLKKLKEKYDRRGIVYISRIPPHLKPQKLRQMLEQYAEIGRVYLAPEDPALRRKRKQKGGNSGKNFTEGWVEFEDKAKAKEVVEMLNGQQMGGKRRSAYYYDLWCMKYLPKFKWDHLTEEINYQKAVREQKLTAEISAAKRERDFYLSRVDKAKAVKAMLERKRKRSGGDGGSREGGEEQQAAAGAGEGAQAPAAGAAPRGGAQGSGEGGMQRPSKQAKQRHGGQDGGGGGADGVQQQRRQQQQGQKGGSEGAADGGGGSGGGGVKVLRTYGQRQAKADPVTSAAAPVLSSGLLKLIAGKRQGGGSTGND